MHIVPKLFRVKIKNNRIIRFQKKLKNTPPKLVEVRTDASNGVRCGDLEMSNWNRPIQRQILLYKYIRISLTGAVLSANDGTNNFRTVRDIALGKSKFSQEIQNLILLYTSPNTQNNMDEFLSD